MIELAPAPSNGALAAQEMPPAAAPPSVVSSGGPRMPRREREVQIPEYPGMTARLWLNYPRRIYSDLRSGDAERVEAALRQVVVSHNGWCDEDGAPLPPPSTAEFWQAIPDELAAALVALLHQEQSVLPNSILARNTR